MDWQPIAVAAVVVAAALYLGRATYRTWFDAKAGCASGCGKCGASAAAPTDPRRRSLPQV